MRGKAAGAAWSGLADAPRALSLGRAVHSVHQGVEVVNSPLTLGLISSLLLQPSSSQTAFLYNTSKGLKCITEEEIKDKTV